MQTHYTETSTDVDLKGLENAIREHAQRIHKLEREGAERGVVVPFPTGDHESQSAA